MKNDFVGALSHADEKPTLEQAQAILGGYVEMVHVGDMQVLINEEGRMLEMPLNEKASEMFGQPLYGPVLILEGDARWD